MSSPVSAVAENVGDRITVHTSRFGQVAVEADKILTLTSPILGFPDSRRYFLKPHSQGSAFIWLQSLDEPELAFVCLHPHLFLADYRPEIPASVRRELQLADGEMPDLLVLLTVPPGEPRKMTANLLGPLVLNVSARLGRQLLLDPHRYDPCYRLFPEEG